MKQHEQALLYLRKAAEDESLLDATAHLPGVADAIYGFHCQQAAEKLLKALLSELRVRFPRTHDLEELLHLLETAGHQVPDELARVDEFSSYAVEFRYGDVMPAAHLDRQAARELIRNLRALVETHVKPSLP